MAIERTYYCDSPDCGDEQHGSCHVRTLRVPPYLPSGFLEVREGHHDGPDLHFCSWDCLMKYAAKFPPPERIEAFESGPEDDG